MTNPTLPRRPGDLFLDRYLPNASEQEREEAYANLRGLVAILVEIDERLTREARERIRANSAGAVDSGLPA